MALHPKYKDLYYPEYEMVGEHKIKLPPLPDNPKEVFFIDDDPEDAFWNRERIIKKDYRDIWFKFVPNETFLTPESLNYTYPTEFDDDGFAISLNEEDSKYIRFCYEREMVRRTKGVHFRNGNEIAWVSGDNWFTLMWCKTKRPDKKGDYFDFREYQQKDFFWLIHHVNSSPIISGCFWSKAKKTGITNLMWLYLLNKATMTKNINMGNMNIDQDKGAKTFVDHFLYAYNGLPLALKPEFKAKSEKEGTITFGRRYISKKSNRVVSDDELNTQVKCVATLMNAFDVDVFTDIWYDEPPKYKSDFGAVFRSNSGATKLQDFVVGRQWLTSYTPEKAGESFMSSKKIFYDSELKTISEHSEGKTKSGLICHHIPATKSWATSFNKYGKCDEKQAYAKITLELDLLADRPHEYLKKKREYAITKKDAWSVGDSTSVYDPIRLGELEFELDQRQRAEPLFTYGELQWENPIWEIGKKDRRPKGVFGPVKFVPQSKEATSRGVIGKMRQYEVMPKEYTNIPLRIGMNEYGNLMPPSPFYQVGGIDPTEYREIANEEEGSMMAMYSQSVHNTAANTFAGKVVTNIIFSEYYFRPDNPEESYQDIVKWIIYHGCLVILEANNSTWATRLEAEGLGHYMLFKNSDGIIVPYVDNHRMLPADLGGNLKHIKAVKSGGVDTTADMIIYNKAYLLKADKANGEIDYGELIKSERLLAQHKDLDPADTKKSDLHQAWGWTRTCHENYLALLQKPKQDYSLDGYQVNAILSAFLK